MKITRDYVLVMLCGQYISFRPLLADDLEIQKLRKKRNLSVCALMKVLFTMKSKPEFFGSFSIPEFKFDGIEDKKYVIYSEIVKNFTRKISRDYPLCWLIRKTEIANHSFLHFHILGALCDKSQSRDEKNKNIKKIWRKSVKDILEKNGIQLVITKNIAKKMCIISDYQDEHKSYLVKSDKNDAECEFIKKYPNAKMWSVVNKKNIKFHEPEYFIMDTETFKKMRKYIWKNVDSNIINMADLKHRLTTKSNRVTYSKGELLRQAIYHALGWENNNE